MNKKKRQQKAASYGWSIVLLAAVWVFVCIDGANALNDDKALVGWEHHQLIGCDCHAVVVRGVVERH